MTLESGVTAEIWRDPAATPEERAGDLVARMTTREKVAQLYGVWVGIDSAGADVAPHQHELATLPRAWEECSELVLGLWLIASPWVLKFNTISTSRNAAVATGIVIAALALWVLLADKDYSGWLRKRLAHQ